MFLYFQTLNTLKCFLCYIVFGIVRNKSNCTRKIVDLIFSETNHTGNECELLVNSGYVATFPLSLCHKFFRKIQSVSFGNAFVSYHCNITIIDLTLPYLFQCLKYDSYQEIPITKALTEKTPFFVLSSAYTSNKVSVLPLTYLGMHLLH